MGLVASKDASKPIFFVLLYLLAVSVFLRALFRSALTPLAPSGLKRVLPFGSSALFSCSVFWRLRLLAVARLLACSGL